MQFDEVCKKTSHGDGSDGLISAIRTVPMATLTCIAGGMAEAMYGVPEELKEECRKRLEPDMVKVLNRFDQHVTG